MHFSGITTSAKRARASRLRSEASNCLAVALAANADRESSAQLIDEAARLARRARELGGANDQNSRDSANSTRVRLKS